MTNNDFSTRTQDMIQSATATILAVVVILFALLATGVIPPAPWSPMGQAAQAAPTFVSDLFNPDATLDTSRVHDQED
jgi:hypothetical protein